MTYTQDTYPKSQGGVHHSFTSCMTCRVLAFLLFCVVNLSALDTNQISNPCDQAKQNVLTTNKFLALNHLDVQTFLQTDSWTLLASKDDKKYQDVIRISDRERYCLQKSTCGTANPWYLVSPAQPRSGERGKGELCTTEVTGRRVSLCCQRSIPVEWYGCPDGYIAYRLPQPIPAGVLTTGSICTQHHEKASDAIPMKYITFDGFYQPMWLNEIPESVKKEIVTVVFQIEYGEKHLFNEVYTFQALRRAIVQRWNTEKIWRRKRAVGDNYQYDEVDLIEDWNVRSVKGSPSGDDVYAKYSFYIQDDWGNMVLAHVLVEFIQRNFKGTDVTAQLISRVDHIHAGIDRQIAEYNSRAPPSEPSPAAKNKASPSAISYITKLQVLTACLAFTTHTWR